MARATAKAGKAASSQPQRTTRSSLSRAQLAELSNQASSLSDSDDCIRVSPPITGRTAKTMAKPIGRAKSTTDSATASGSASMASDSEYETPGTTPAMSARGGPSTKRKRLTVDDDAAIALQLQEEEYAEEAPSKRTKRSPVIKDEIEDSDLSEAMSVDDEPLAIRTKGVNNKSIARAARAAVAKAISRAIKKEAIKEESDEELEDIDDEDSFIDDDDAQTDYASSEAEEAESEEDEDEVPLAAVAAVSRQRSQANAARGRRTRRAIEGQIMDRKARRALKERKKLEKSHPEIKTMWSDLEKTSVIKPVEAAQPTDINRKLKPFQLQGLDWLTKQEQTAYRGGLLGDEMGMGKTIQAVSLIMSDYPQKQPTLVVVPPVALMQWQSEIKDYTENKLKVFVYHGSNAKVKKMSVKELKQYDVIMISYNSLESLHRKETKGWSRGEDIIKEDSPIHAIHFHRLILDEAHCIKTRTTGVAKACFALKGTYKWCLSGTPVQNRIGEFFSLLRFLEVRPFADYFCKKCSCATPHWQVDANHNCVGCGHTGMEHVSVFNQEILNPLTDSTRSGERNAAMSKLHMITSRIMLRRVKKDHTSTMELPPKEVVVASNFFGDVEKDFSSSIMSNSERKFNTYVSQHVMLNNYANIFGLIMQMRQVANHPDLLLRKHAAEGQNVIACQLCDEVAEDAIRSQCKHDFCRACIKTYMAELEANGRVPDCPRCHIALAIDLEQQEIEQDEENVKKSSIINRIKMEDWTSSTKIEMLVYELYKLRSKKQTTKSIVFSNFTSMLQLVEWRLRRAGFNTVMLDGSMTPIQRQRSIEYFMTNPTVEVFLVSLKAGGVALNLTEASRVFIVDPWWNPAAEWQSADRCHRIGQRRPCVITRLCIEDSVESRMVMLQEKKANMINSTINQDKASFDKLTPEDMQFLFRGN